MTYDKQTKRRKKIDKKSTLVTYINCKIKRKIHDLR